MTNNNRLGFNTALAIFPSKDGFGWIIFDGPLSPVAWDICAAAKLPGTPQEKNARCMKHVDAVVSEYRPSAIVLEAFEGPGTRRNKRIQELCRSVASLAAMNGTLLRVVSREQIKSCFESTASKTRYGIASTVAAYLKEIRHRLPDKRRPWETENFKMALFNAAALLIVHYSNPIMPPSEMGG